MTTSEKSRLLLVGRLMPFPYLLQSAIDRGLRRTGFGHERSFDTDHHIGNNLRAGFFSAHSHGDQTN
ncbi:hypothetical protein ABH943_009089, partial [Caballeronia udeis]